MTRLSWNARLRLFAAAAAVAILASGWSCVSGRTAPEPAQSSLVVRNRSYFDVNVYVLPSASGIPVRLGTVVGESNSTFTLRSHHLQPGGFLVVQLHAIGARGSWTSGAVSVSEGLLAVLDVNADSFGDCSTSSLHTIVATDTIPPHGS